MRLNIFLECIRGLTLLEYYPKYLLCNGTKKKLVEVPRHGQTQIIFGRSGKWRCDLCLRGKAIMLHQYKHMRFHVDIAFDQRLSALEPDDKHRPSNISLNRIAQPHIEYVPNQLPGC